MRKFWGWKYCRHVQLSESIDEFKLTVPLYLSTSDFYTKCRSFRYGVNSKSILSKNLFNPKINLATQEVFELNRNVWQ